jgi:predicted O-methyltransferase YrrM
MWTLVCGEFKLPACQLAVRAFMTRVRDELIRSLWRGKDPFAKESPYDGPRDLQGWGSEHPYLREAIRAIRPAVVIEIGVWKGGSTIHMASILRELAIDGVVIAIDTWLGAWDHWINDQWFGELGLADSAPSLFQKFSNNVRKAELTDYVVPLPLDSINAAKVLRHFKFKPNMVHLDAGHDYQAVTSDLQQWWPALEPGGILVGDDYRDGNAWPEVKRAFDNYFEQLGLMPIRNSKDKCILIKPVEIEAVGSPIEGVPPSQETDQVAAEVRKWREACRLEFDALATDQSISLDDLVRRYVAFVGPKWEGIRHEIMERITGKLRETGLQCTRQTLFTDDGGVRPNGPSVILNAVSGQYLKPAAIAEFEVLELLPVSSNPFYSKALPNPINKNMARDKRPALNAYRGKGLDLFVSPLGYQLCDQTRGIFWPEASTRTYPSSTFGLVNRDVREVVVIIQDSFEGTNFSHFLFDWVPRLAHFLEAGLVDLRRCLFLMGGAPRDLHSRVIYSLCVMFNLNRDQFIFPTSPEIWRLKGEIYFFSDVKIDIMHPAHMAHERSISLIRRIASSIETSKRSFTRIYISRADTPLRQVANEGELWHYLKSLGFVMIWLSEISLDEQIELIRGADVIVAPHGMGLTHIVFHDAKPLIVELHHPVVGTDAYAFISHALGFRYRSIIGKSAGGRRHDFNIELLDLMAVLTEESVFQASGDVMAHSAPQTRWLGGTQEEKAHEFAGSTPLGRSDKVLIHVRGAQSDNNLGWIEASHLAKGLVYSAACDVWIPVEFKGKDITLGSRELRGSPLTFADLTCRGEWQTLRVNGVAEVEITNFVLRSIADKGEVFYSTRWRVGIGTGA